MNLNKINRLNKKGTFFGLFLVFGTLIILGATIFSFYSAKDKLLLDIESPKYLYQLNAIKEDFTNYEDQSSRLSLQYAFYDLIKNINIAFPNDCQAYKKAIILTDSCLPDDDKIKKSFIENLNAEFQRLIENYPIISLKQKSKIEDVESKYIFSPKFEPVIENNLLIVNYEEQEINLTRKTGFLNYSYYLNLPEQSKINLDNYKIYINDLSQDIITLNSKAKECKNRADINSIKACLNEISLKNFDIDASIDGEYLILILKTKNKLFYIEDSAERFDKISLSFALKI